MKRYKESNFESLRSDFIRQYLPNNCDNLGQIVLKSVFIGLLITVLVVGIYFSIYYFNDLSERNLIEKNRETFLSSPETLHEQNSDYKAWLEIPDSETNYPVFQSDNNSFYLSHNSKKEESSYGTLVLDYRSDLEDNNLVIYGNNPKNGYLFSSLENFRSLDYFKRHSLIKLTDNKGTTNYKVYAVFVLNASKKDDGGHIYDVYRNDFENEIIFENWVGEAKERSIINSSIDVALTDKTLTLITGCDDFENARLVVMARSLREGEEASSQNNNAIPNQKPRYPKKWYKERNIEYPF